MTGVEIFRFELRYQCRRIWPWCVAVVLAVLSALLTTDGMLQEALFENFYINSPYAIATSTVVGLLVWILLSPGIAGDAAARDVATRMYPLLYTAPVGRWAYLGGRFAAALLVNLVLLCALPLGAAAAVYAPTALTGIPPETIGPFRPAAYLTAYCYIGVPTVLAGTALQFALAVRSGRPLTAFLGSVILFFVSHGIGLFLVFQGRQDLANLLDPIGVHFILSDLSHLWTTTQKNVQLLELRGTVLLNRLIWLAFSAATLSWMGTTFRFHHRAEAVRGVSRWGRGWRALGRLLHHLVRRGSTYRVTRDAPPSAATARAALAAPPTTGVSLAWRQLWNTAQESFGLIVSSWAGRALLIGLPLLSVAIVVDQMVVNGVPIVPRTAMVLREITGPLSSDMSRWVIIPLLTAYFAGELVWYERDAGLGDITDAMPGSEWARLLGKACGLAVVLLLFVVMQAAAGMTAQALSGFTDVEPGLYLRVMVGMQWPQFLLFIPLAFVVHVLANQRYVGLMLAVLTYVLMALSPLFGIEHRMLSYGASPSWSYTAMRGFGWSVAPWAWFTLYWAAWGLVLSVLTRLAWVRGRDHRWAARVRAAQARLVGATRVTATVAGTLLACVGGWVFYNTNVRNAYTTAHERATVRAEYERRYAHVAQRPQPDAIHVSATVEFLPAQRTVTATGTMVLVNRTDAPVDTVHVDAPEGGQVDSLRLESARLVVDDAVLRHRVFALNTPLQPGDSVTLHFAVREQARGFTVHGVSEDVVPNGSQISSALLPTIGYQSGREVLTAGDRRRLGLPVRPVVPPLGDTTRLGRRKPGVMYDLTLVTPETQTGVAPGALQQDWTHEGRHYARYVTSAPIGESFAMLSAHYTVHTAQWRNVAIRIYHHPEHGARIPKMLDAIEASMAYYTERFGPYPYSHLTAAEHPGNGSGMHADASILTFSEGFTQWDPEPGRLDMPYAVVAHEMGHQWNIPYASVEGAPVMSESVAWYLAWQVVEHEHGARGLRQLHAFMRQPSPYPPIRRGEPLLRGLDPYMAYRKGPFALNAVREAIGRDAMDGVFRRLLSRHRAPDAPLATTADLYRELLAAAPDSVHPLLHDLFEVNTYWQLTARRARVEPNADGTWRVAVEIQSRKVEFDSAGGETLRPFTDLVEIALYAAPDSTTRPLNGSTPGAADRLSHILYQGRHPLVNGVQTIVVNLPARPVLAGVDPRHVLDWEELDGDNNFTPVEPAPVDRRAMKTPAEVARTP